MCWTRLGWSVFFSRIKEKRVEAPLRFQNSFGLLSFTRGTDSNDSGGGRCRTSTAARSQSCLRDCVLLAWLPEARSSFVHPCPSPTSSCMLAFKGEGEAAGVRVRGHASVNRHAGGSDPILPVDVASQQRRGAFWVWRWRAVAHAFLKTPVHPPVIGHILYCGPFFHSHCQQPVDQGTSICREQSYLDTKRPDQPIDMYTGLRDNQARQSGPLEHGVKQAETARALYLREGWACGNGLWWFALWVWCSWLRQTAYCCTPARRAELPGPSSPPNRQEHTQAHTLKWYTASLAQMAVLVL